MERRREATEETRRRILEATLGLHSERGVFGTSWKDIAERADVSVATVYKHFPSLEELVPACGALIMSITDPPSMDDAARIFGDARTVEERVGRLVSEMFDFYERAEPYMEVGPRERRLPAVQEWEAGMRAVREGLAREALCLMRVDETTVRAVGSLLDFSVFKSFRRHGVAKAEAEGVLKDMLVCWIGGRG